MQKSQNEAVVGLFVILGFAVLCIIVFFVSGVYLFRSGYSVTVMYDYVSILDRGAPVRMAGVRIGEVSRVELLPDEETGKIRVAVKLFIEKEVEIRENYVFKIQGTHILSEPHIEISPQPGEAPLVTDKTVIQGADPVPVEALIARGHQIAEDLEVLIGAVKESVVGDEASAESLKKLIVNLAKLTESLSRLMQGSEEDLRQAFENIRASTDSMRNLLDKMEQGDSTMGKLFTQDELYDDMRGFVTEIRQHPWKLLKKEG